MKSTSFQYVGSILQYFQSFVNTQQQMRSAPPPAVPWSTVPLFFAVCTACINAWVISSPGTIIGTPGG